LFAIEHGEIGDGGRSGDFEIHPAFVTMIVGERHDADRGAAPDAFLGAEDFRKEVG
jgi:hypothetical protein